MQRRARKRHRSHLIYCISIVTVTDIQVMVVMLLVVSAVSIIISFRGYLSGMQKDIGILRHEGYTADRIFDIYKKLISRPFLVIGAISGVYTFILSIIILKSRGMIYFAGIIAILVIFLLIIYSIIRTFLHQITNKNILDLIEKSKEFE